MNKEMKYLTARVRWSWIALAAGVVVFGVGVILTRVNPDSPYNLRTISGLGILLVGVGLGNLLLYRNALKGEAAARRYTIDERDERRQLIRNRAAYWAYRVSAAMTFAGLMWASFASNGDLPDLSGDVLWFFLAACVVIPLGVYIASQMIDDQRL